MKKLCWVLVAYTFNPSTWETEAVGSLRVPGQPSLQSDFQGSQATKKDKETLSRKKTKNKKTTEEEETFNIAVFIRMWYVI